MRLEKSIAVRQGMTIDFVLENSDDNNKAGRKKESERAAEQASKISRLQTQLTKEVEADKKEFSQVIAALAHGATMRHQNKTPPALEHRLLAKRPRVSSQSTMKLHHGFHHYLTTPPLSICAEPLQVLVSLRTRRGR